MKINRFVVLAMIVLLVVTTMGAVAMRAAAQSGSPSSPEVENEGPDVPITGDALERASAAALEYVGEGQVTETEVGDEEGYYEVEVTLDDGSQVDVHLDENFNVLSQASDGEGS